MSTEVKMSKKIQTCPTSNCMYEVQSYFLKSVIYFPPTGQIWHKSTELFPPFHFNCRWYPLVVRQSCCLSKHHVWRCRNRKENTSLVCAYLFHYTGAAHTFNQLQLIYSLCKVWGFLQYVYNNLSSPQHNNHFIDHGRQCTSSTNLNFWRQSNKCFRKMTIYHSYSLTAFS